MTRGSGKPSARVVLFGADCECGRELYRGMALGSGRQQQNLRLRCCECHSICRARVEHEAKGATEVMARD